MPSVCRYAAAAAWSWHCQQSKCLAARDQHHSFPVYKLLLQLQAVCSCCSLPRQHGHVPHMLQRCLHHLMLPDETACFKVCSKLKGLHPLHLLTIASAWSSKRILICSEPFASYQKRHLKVCLSSLFYRYWDCTTHCVARRLAATNVSNGFL